MRSARPQAQLPWCRKFRQAAMLDSGCYAKSVHGITFNNNQSLSNEMFYKHEPLGKNLAWKWSQWRHHPVQRRIDTFRSKGLQNGAQNIHLVNCDLLLTRNAQNMCQGQISSFQYRLNAMQAHNIWRIGALD